MARRIFDPERDDPKNGTHHEIKEVYDQLVENGYGVGAAALRSDRYSRDGQLRKARQLKEEHFTPDSVAEQTQEALSSVDDEERQSEAEALLARADTLEPVDDEYADGLRAEAFALAAHGEPESHLEALGTEQRSHAKELLDRAETMRFDPDVHEDLERRAAETIEETVESAYADADNVTDHVIERDVEATVEALREAERPGDDQRGDRE